MRFEETITVDASIETVRAFFQDVLAVADCVPGLEGTTLVEPNVYDGRLRIRIGLFSFTIAGRMHIEQAADGAWRLRGEGRDTRTNTGATVAIEAHLRALTATTTNIDASADLEVTGRLGGIGQPLIRRRAESLLKDFTTNLQRHFRRR